MYVDDIYCGFFIFIPIVYQTPEKYEEEKAKEQEYLLRKWERTIECSKAREECDALFYSADRIDCHYRVKEACRSM